MLESPRQYITKTLRILALFFIFIFGIRLFAIEPGVVANRSMEPTFLEGDPFIIDKLSVLFVPFYRGQVVQVYDKTDRILYIKRIIGLPGEHITINKQHVVIRTKDGQTLTLNEPYVNPRPFFQKNWTPPEKTDMDIPEDAYFVMGDNRGISKDSRSMGPVQRSFIFGAIRRW